VQLHVEIYKTLQGKCRAFNVKILPYDLFLNAFPMNVLEVLVSERDHHRHSVLKFKDHHFEFIQHGVGRHFIGAFIDDLEI
jgi:hypothetical protein